MKYFLLNKEEVKKDIFVNPILVRTKSMVKIKKYKTLKKKLDTLLNQITKELRESNTKYSSQDIYIDQLLNGENITEITNKDYNALYGLALYDTQEQRINVCNRSEVLKGKLWGNEIR